MTTLEVTKIFLSCLFVFPITALSTDLKVLLKSQIEDAKCSAKCLNVPTMEEKTLCFEICKLTQESAKPDICKFPKYCTGGCKTACENVAENEAHNKFEFYSVSQCSLNWRISQDSEQNILFVLGGQDQEGMWNIVSSRLETNRIAWTDRNVAKYVKLSILAVGEGDVVDTLEIGFPGMLERVVMKWRRRLYLHKKTLLGLQLSCLAACLPWLSVSLAVFWLWLGRGNIITSHSLQSI